MTISTFQDLFLYLRSLSCLIDLVTYGLRSHKPRIRLPLDEMDKAYSMNLCNGVFKNFEDMYEQVNLYRLDGRCSSNAMFARFRNTDNINFQLVKKSLEHLLFECDLAIDMDNKKKLDAILPQAMPIIQYVEHVLASQFHVKTIFQWFYMDLENRMNACMYKYEKYRSILDVLFQKLDVEDRSRYLVLTGEFTSLLAQCKSFINEAMEDSSFSELRAIISGPEPYMDYSRLITLYHRCLLRIDAIPYRIQMLYRHIQKEFPDFDTRFDYKEFKMSSYSYYCF
jgi:hypothetical protein